MHDIVRHEWRIALSFVIQLAMVHDNISMRTRRLLRRIAMIHARDGRNVAGCSKIAVDTDCHINYCGVTMRVHGRIAPRPSGRLRDVWSPSRNRSGPRGR